MRKMTLHNRLRAFPAAFTPAMDRQLNLTGAPFLKRQRPTQKTKIFMVKMRQPTRGTASGRGMHRVVIFDDHPESLRLMRDRYGKPRRKLFGLERAALWEFLLAAVLTLAAVMGIFWPLL